MVDGVENCGAERIKNSSRDWATRIPQGSFFPPHDLARIVSTYFTPILPTDFDNICQHNIWLIKMLYTSFTILQSSIGLIFVSKKSTNDIDIHEINATFKNWWCNWCNKDKPLVEMSLDVVFVRWEKSRLTTSQPRLKCR